MKKENQRNVAASLLSSMETVTIAMMKSFDKPVVEKIEEENMGDLFLHSYTALLKKIGKI